MTMHLEGPWLSMSGKKRGKVKFRNAEEARRARELDESWQRHTCTCQSVHRYQGQGYCYHAQVKCCAGVLRRGGSGDFKDAPWVKELLFNAFTILKCQRTIPTTLTPMRQACILPWVIWAVMWAGKIDWQSTVIEYGVKIVKDRINWYGGMYGAYVTNNQKAMKEFAWIKLSARPLEMR